MGNDFQAFRDRNNKFIHEMNDAVHLQELSREWYLEATRYEYPYHFEWLGVPIIQFPQDVMAMQELIWRIKPDLIIETGVARGGSVIFYASMLALLGQQGKVLGIDIDIRSHNREVIESHAMSQHITLFEGSSIDPNLVSEVQKFASQYKRVMVLLDSNHTHEHVLKELEAYHRFVSPESYLVVFDTMIEYTPSCIGETRPWGIGNSPKTAIDAFLKHHDEFTIDHGVTDKLLISEAKGGYLKRIQS